MNEIKKYLKNEKLTKYQINIYKDSLSSLSYYFMVEDEYEEFYKNITDLIVRLDKVKIPVYVSKCMCHKSKNGTTRFAFDFPISRESLSKNIALENIRTENGGGTLVIKFDTKIKLEIGRMAIYKGNCSGIQINGRDNYVKIVDKSRMIINNSIVLRNSYAESKSTIFIDLIDKINQ